MRPWSSSSMPSGWVTLLGRVGRRLGVYWSCLKRAAGVPLKIGCLTTPARFFSEALLALGGL